MNTYRPVLERFERTFGGTVTTHRRGDDKARLTWCWRCYGDTAAKALVALLPVLREKRAQAYLGLHFRELPKGAARECVVEALTLLKKTTHHKPS